MNKRLNVNEVWGNFFFIFIPDVCLIWMWRQQQQGKPIRILQESPKTLLGGHSGMAHGLDNTLRDAAGINTRVTNKCVVKGILIACFVGRVSLWHRRETFVSLFHRWPHGALDESPPPCFNWPLRQWSYSYLVTRSCRSHHRALRCILRLG